MNRGPSLTAIIWGVAFIAMASLAMLRQLQVLTPMTFLALLAPLGLIVIGALGLVFSSKRDKTT